MHAAVVEALDACKLAWTCYDYADTLLEGSTPGDREQAMSLLDDSLSISNRAGYAAVDGAGAVSAGYIESVGPTP
jgi:hypothetical protein